MNALTAVFKGRPTKAEPVIPTLESVSPEYAELAAKKRAVLDQYGTVQRHIRHVLTEIEAERLKEAPRRPTADEKRIAEIVGDPVPPTLTVFDSLVATSSELDQRSRDLASAIDLLDGRLDRARGRASAIVCEAIEDHYRSLVSNICWRLLEVYQAAAEYEQFTDKLTAAGVYWSSLWPMHLRFGGASDRNSELARYLREAADRGFIKRSDLPKALR